jgi:xylono-1,5-lactonase
METSTRVTCVSESGATLGEGPVWDDRSQKLYWVDIESMTLHRCAQDGSDAIVWRMPQKIGCVALRADREGFVGGFQSSIATFTLDPLIMAPIAFIQEPAPNSRSNDGKCDMAGRFWLGTCDQTGQKPTGYLYRIGADHSMVRAAGPFICTNGPAFAPDGHTLYCVDSYARAIFAFDLDRLGNLSRQRTLIRFEDPSWGYPDGLTCDSRGSIWVAHWGGSRVSRFSADGQLLGAIGLPVSQPTSCTFGGSDLKTLFITSASVGIAEGCESKAGAIFSVRVDEGGFPAARYKD